MFLGTNLLGSNLLGSAIRRWQVIVPFDVLTEQPCNVDAPVDNTNTVPITVVNIVLAATLILTAGCSIEQQCPGVIAPTVVAENHTGDLGANIDWTPVGTYVFQLWRREGLSGVPVKLYEGPGAGVPFNYFDITVVSGTDYYYWITVIFTDAPCGATNSIEVLYNCALPTIVASSDSATLNYLLGQKKVTLSWFSSGATSVLINGVAVDLYGSLDVSPAVDTSYVFTVVGLCGTVFATVDITVVCDVPTPLDLVAGNGTIQVGWYDQPAGLVYSIYRVAVPGPDVLIGSGTTDGSDVVIDDAGLLVSTLYSYYVIVNFGGDCGNQTSVTSSETTLDCDLPTVAATPNRTTIHTELGEDSVTLSVVSTNIGAGTLVFVMTVGGVVIETWNATGDTTETHTFYPTADCIITYTATTACGTVIGTVSVAVVSEQTPVVAISIDSSPACPGVAYLDWTIANAIPGKVTIEGPMFGDGVTPVVVNAGGQTSGHMLITLLQGTRTP